MTTEVRPAPFYLHRVHEGFIIFNLSVFSVPTLCSPWLEPNRFNVKTLVEPTETKRIITWEE